MANAVLDQNCVFCKIIRGEIPCQRVYQDKHVLAFLDIQPLAPGHTVVIPRHHAEFLDQLPEDWAVAIGRTLGRLGRAVVNASGADGFNVLQNNGRAAEQEVPHVHFHLIPRHAGDGLGYRWKAKKAAPAELEKMAAAITSRL
ncbi:MAG: HIT family protein [Phycisphaerae bacterium]|jgi:histidine triad (HIT) family protein|nr:HIT family protein [Phycisphaerae bacterium]HOO17718.1 HIT family protein [Phycisphaerae bacterium]HPC23236.1 HIT family protein [Phycisphaerae bacterium]HRS27066.1 HIT family protein [Phycisphaerae bacterium]HRT40676.1 HIT family protein [Phycisphaerae bacterium]